MEGHEGEPGGRGPGGIADLRPLDEVNRRPLGRKVWAWGLWDWGSAAFNAVVTTFVFGRYIAEPDFFGPGASSKLGWAMAGAGLLIAITAPVAGVWADRSGRRTLWLGINTGFIVVCTAALWFVEPSPSYLWLGLLILAAGNVFFELAEVHYNAMLNELATPVNVGRISGLGWGLGYIGGIVLLLIAFFGFISPDQGLFGVSDEGATDVRATMLLAAVWTLLFSIPVLVTRRPREVRPDDAAGFSVTGAYRELFCTIARLWRTERNLLYFLGAAAIFRDGLAGVFTFGAIIASQVFDFSDDGVIMFAIVANVVAGLATVAGGYLDDVIGPRRLISGALGLMVVSGLVIFYLHDGGQRVFWIFGLILCIFVGPAQSASRTFLSRMIPRGHEGEIFGLYATTGRAVSFLAPLMFSVSIAIGAGLSGGHVDDHQQWGILGIVVVIATGLGLLLALVRDPERAHLPPRGFPAS